MLDLDEMKLQWAEQDRKLDQLIRLNKQLLCTKNLDAAHSRLQRMSAFLGLEALAWLGVVIVLGIFLDRHFALLNFALPAAALDLYAIGMLAATLRPIVAALRIDYAQPVTAIQKQFETLRVMRIRLTQWGILAGAVLWAPFVIVASKAIFGVEIHSGIWLWTNVFFGLSLIPLTLWLSKNFSHRLGRSRLIQRLMKDIAGHNLNAAGSFLARLSEFEDEQVIK